MSAKSIKIYKGKRVGPPEGLPLEEPNDVIVTVNNKPLKHRIYHSPSGFNWGYLGSGPGDLARSILWDYLGNEPPRNMYMDFKERFVSGWGNEWEISSQEIQDWMKARNNIFRNI
jgi:hypothetical protein